MEVANRMHECHKLLTELFWFLGVDEKTARKNAMVERDVSDAICRHAKANREQT